VVPILPSAATTPSPGWTPSLIIRRISHAACCVPSWWTGPGPESGAGEGRAFWARPWNAGTEIRVRGCRQSPCGHSRYRHKP
jgi:hypothetical protein